MRAMNYGILLTGLLMALSPAWAESPLVIHSVKGKFDDVKANVEFAIENRGLVVNNVSHVGEMLERTGKDLGDAKRVFVKAEVLEFCSAQVSRQVMEADPHTIAFCPYTIAVYVLPQEPDKVYVSYRRPELPGPGGKTLQAVDKLLASIVADALKP